METMNYKEAAEFLRINAGTLRNWVSQGKFIKPLKRHGVKGRVLFLRSEVEAWLEKHARRKLDRGSDQVALDQEKELAFTVKLFNNSEPGKKGILALVKELEALENSDSMFGGLSGPELRAVAKAFFDYAKSIDDRRVERQSDGKEKKS